MLMTPMTVLMLHSHHPQVHLHPPSTPLVPAMPEKISLRTSTNDSVPKAQIPIPVTGNTIVNSAWTVNYPIHAVSVPVVYVLSRVQVIKNKRYYVICAMGSIIRIVWCRRCWRKRFQVRMRIGIVPRVRLPLPTIKVQVVVNHPRVVRRAWRVVALKANRKRRRIRLEDQRDRRINHRRRQPRKAVLENQRLLLRVLKKH
mmetsp:Transcript_15224/g.22790  ORF Transcript_15224/g.22790 Transcript_15224/m.22790 type:complete len:200 (-) Transcript_15224:2318-2917(-)